MAPNIHINGFIKNTKIRQVHQLRQNVERAIPVPDGGSVMGEGDVRNCVTGCVDRVNYGSSTSGGRIG